MALRFDEIGYWSEIKLQIIREFATAYSRILAAQRKPSLEHVYVDGFSGAGEHRLKSTGEMVSGSPLNALQVQPPFKEYHLIDLNRAKVEHLASLIGDRPDVHIYNGDCNDVLVNRVLPQIRYDRYRRGLCILDPYGLHLDWEVMRLAGQSRVIDMFLNFPVMDMNMNILWKKGEGPNQDGAQVARMNRFWGDESWRHVAYVRSNQTVLFGEPPELKLSNDDVAEGFRERLRNVAGFKHVPKPLPMTNSQGKVVYYLFFASQKDVANHIVLDIFNKHSPHLA